MSLAIGKIAKTAVGQLSLDGHNPRLPESLVGAPQAEILKHLFVSDSLGELAKSFVDNGYFDVEPLVAVRENGKLVVVEGNRRLATLKILLNDPDAEGLSFIGVEAGAARLEELKEVPVFLAADRPSVQSFIGFRHIGGLKLWEPEAKARYLFQQTREAAQSDSRNAFVDIGRRTGTNASTVRNAYLAHAILAYARDEKGLPVDKLVNDRGFGVWLRALSSATIKHFIGLRDAKSYEDVELAAKSVDLDRLAEVIQDLTRQPGASKAVVSDSRMLTVYGQILTHERAYARLRATGSIALASEELETQNLQLRLKQVINILESVRETIGPMEEVEEDLRREIKRVADLGTALLKLSAKSPGE